MWIVTMLLYAASLHGQLPKPVITLDFEAAPLPASATVSGETELVPGKAGQAIRLTRSPEPEDLTRLVYKAEGRHCGFPNLIRLHNGELLANFREGPGHVGHGVIKQMRSTDDGKSWSRPGTIFEDPDWDSRSHSTGIQLKSGTILLGFYRHGNGKFPLARVLRSTDGGRTYAPIDLPNPYADTYVYNIGRPIQLDDGSVLMPLHGEMPDGRKATGIIRSKDDGLTWGDFSVIAHGERNYFEANILMLPNGEMLAMNRTEPEPWMWQCRSSDKGYTWSKPENSGMQGDVGELLLLSSGNIMCAYRSQAPGTSDTRASISRDGGHTWTDEIVLDPNDGDRGYTSSIQFPDGRILTLNYSTKDGLTQIRSRLFDESVFDNAKSVQQAPGYVQIPYSPDLPLRDSLTLMAWIKPTSEHKWQRIFWKDGILSLYLNEGHLDGWVFTEEAGDARDVVAEATIPVGEWTHVAMTYSPDDPAQQVHIYINSKQANYKSVEKTRAGARILGGEKPLFLSSPIAPFAFDGLMDDVRVYDVALTAEQIREAIGGER